jgi:PAS domain S-box-containing protein
VSDRASAYFGKTPEQVVGDQWLSVLHADDVAPTIARWQRCVATGEPYETEFRLWSASHGAYRWHLARATAQRDAHGAIIRWFGTNTDIEEWKQAEAELKRLTIEATEANRAKSDFLAAMSHELRTPLNAIGGYAQLIEMGVRGPVTEEQRIDLLKIQRSKDHLDGLVRDVLNFAKVGSGRIELRIVDVDVRRTVDAVLDMVSPQIAQKKIRLAPFGAPSGLTLHADADRTLQILVNLFANALKFTPAGGTISLAVRASDHEIAISIADTGIGIPRDQQERIFEPFVQADRALHSSDQGVGLGLAISRKLARAMRGTLTVESTVGAGSTFTLTLPRAG